MKTEVVMVAVGAVALAVFYVGKNPSSVGQQIGGAVVDLATGALTGATFAAGDAFGLPDTRNAAVVSQGEAEMAAGDYWNASFHLPAGDFISGVWNRLTN